MATFVPLIIDSGSSGGAAGCFCDTFLLERSNQFSLQTLFKLLQISIGTASNQYPSNIGGNSSHINSAIAVLPFAANVRLQSTNQNYSFSSTRVVGSFAIALAASRNPMHNFNNLQTENNHD